MLRGLPHSFEETAVLLSFSQHIKDLCFFISLYVQVSCYEVEQRGTQKQSSPGVFVNIVRLTCLQFGMCIYFFSAGLWHLFKQLQPQRLLENTPFWLFCLNTRVK